MNAAIFFSFQFSVNRDQLTKSGINLGAVSGSRTAHLNDSRETFKRGILSNPLESEKKAPSKHLQTMFENRSNGSNGSTIMNKRSPDELQRRLSPVDQLSSED